jgi:hypothetical protein
VKEVYFFVGREREKRWVEKREGNFLKWEKMGENSFAFNSLAE